MRRQDASDELALLCHDELLVLGRISPAFCDQRCDIGLLQEKFVEPCDLGENLEVGDVLGVEGALQCFGIMLIALLRSEQLK